MSSNLLLFGWDRSIPGREKISGAHFQEFVQYLGELQKQGTIKSFDTVFLDAHGGDLNGFFLLKGDPAKLDALTASDAWVAHLTRAALHLQSPGVIRGVTGDLIAKRMELWAKAIPA